MQGLAITRVDVHDDTEVAEWLALIGRARRHDLGDHATVYTLPETLAQLRSPNLHVDKEPHLAVLDGEPVAAVMLEYPLLDNTTAVDLDLDVVPERRRQGIGSAVLEYAEAAARERGRSRFDALTSWPYAGPADGVGVAGVEFGRRHGYRFGIGDIQRELRLPVGPALLQELAEETAAYTNGYEIRTWAGRYPDDLLPSYLDLASRLNVEAPMGANEYEAESTDIAAARLREENLEREGRVAFHAAAIAPDGTVAAYSDIMLPLHDVAWAFQWGTLVAPAHRGRRLGIALKVANLRLLQADARSAGRRLATWNADVNEHMIAINDRLGFVPTCRAAELQKKL